MPCHPSARAHVAPPPCVSSPARSFLSLFISIKYFVFCDWRLDLLKTARELVQRPKICSHELCLSKESYTQWNESRSACTTAEQTQCSENFILSWSCIAGNGVVAAACTVTNAPTFTRHPITSTMVDDGICDLATSNRGARW